MNDERAGASLSEIEVVYRERFAEFVRVVAAITGDRASAADVVQDAFAVLIRKRALFRRRGSLDGWVWRTVVNTALNSKAAAYRRRGDRSPPGLEASNGRPEEIPGLASVRDQLGRLPRRQRLVVFLRYYADLEYSTIGETLGISPGTVASTLSGAHNSIRRGLSREARL
jgi:RNA polymerase sigma factor (sigma-70 family)